MAALHHGYLTSTTPGTAVPFATGSTPVPATWFTVFPRVVSGNANAGEVRLGGPPLPGDNGAIPPGKGMRLSPGDASVAWPEQGAFDLRQVYMDVDSSGDGVQYVWSEY